MYERGLSVEKSNTWYGHCDFANLYDCMQKQRQQRANRFYDNSTDLYTGTFYKSIKMEAPKKGNVEHTSDSVSLGKEKIFFYETYHDLKEDAWYRKFEIYSPSEKEKSDKAQHGKPRN